MIETNSLIFQFVDGNWLALTLALGVLKVIAKLTPWSADDTLVELIKGVFNEARGLRKSK